VSRCNSIGEVDAENGGDDGSNWKIAIHQIDRPDDRRGSDTAGNRAQNGTNGRATADVLAGSFIRTEPARTRAFLSILFCKKVFVAAYGN